MALVLLLFLYRAVARWIVSLVSFAVFLSLSLSVSLCLLSVFLFIIRSAYPLYLAFALLPLVVGGCTLHFSSSVVSITSITAVLRCNRFTGPLCCITLLFITTIKTTSCAPSTDPNHITNPLTTHSYFEALLQLDFSQSHPRNPMSLGCPRSDRKS